MIAITKVPVMYRLLENSGEPAKTADTRREHPPKEAVDRPGEPVEGRGGNNHRPQFAGRPVTSAGDETPLIEWRFVRLQGK